AVRTDDGRKRDPASGHALLGLFGAVGRRRGFGLGRSFRSRSFGSNFSGRSFGSNFGGRGLDSSFRRSGFGGNLDGRFLSRRSFGGRFFLGRCVRSGFGFSSLRGALFGALLGLLARLGLARVVLRGALHEAGGIEKA